MSHARWTLEQFLMSCTTRVCAGKMDRRKASATTRVLASAPSNSCCACMQLSPGGSVSTIIRLTPHSLNYFFQSPFYFYFNAPLLVAHRGTARPEWGMFSVNAMPGW